MDWSDPKARLSLIEEVGPEKFGALLRAHEEACVVDTVNGYRIRTTETRFGTLYTLEGTRAAYASLARARDEAMVLPHQA
ncbi:hypothetical protein [Salipiger mucosus]|uniref:Uncharacterized protein n=1 Tax=Salipiger mucosus DSM 16094 TaxID=1123237 RepID=S9QQA4_9RHOB|nr:hypothetical protein [Salipiger mucosus]EPX83571.1 hypothetical protein Salmuc_02179 [Salipiger mucosus DSM 16094]